jgi:hypothetical protein
MKANVGSADRIVRILVGIAILAVLALVEGPARWFGLVGFVPLLTGIFGYCPLYAVLGFDTCPLARKPS